MAALRGLRARLARLLPPPPPADDTMTAYARRTWPRILPPSLLDFPPATA